MAKKKKFVAKSATNETKGKQTVKKGLKAKKSSDSDSDDDLEKDINDFHVNRDKELLERSALSQDVDDSDDDNAYGSDEEVMPLDESTDDDDDEDEGHNRFGIELKKDEMASDLEDESDDQLVDTNAWGNRKNAFYNTDYVDKDFRKYTQKDSDLAQFEEEEALQIQKRLLQSISESDVGLEWLVGDIEPKTGFNDNRYDDKEEDEQRLQTNVSNLTKRQKLEILAKESPELEPLIIDFQTYMNEMKDRLLPVMQAIKDRKVFKLNGFKYIETRFHISVKEHPVLKQMLSFKKLLLELNSMASKQPSIDRDIDAVLDKCKVNERLRFERKRTKNEDKKVGKEKRVKFVDDIYVNEMTAPDDQLGVGEEATKRGITYEMAKNKGLTPKRKKELKNPRVKHRMKYRKAKIRRKGQVREPRKELQRYGGEMSGIKSGVVKSVKFR